MGACLDVEEEESNRSGTCVYAELLASTGACDVVFAYDQTSDIGISEADKRWQYRMVLVIMCC